MSPVHLLLLFTLWSLQESPLRGPKNARLTPKSLATYKSPSPGQLLRHFYPTGRWQSGDGLRLGNQTAELGVLHPE